ncbi:hypothetical protein QVD17_17344 [Tagetes erecta]|uniref:BHLH domain-containing protein n=1 Tax=Tagetes erecta TaxID=13708 RepID=A0AAD8P1C3_TARER|nr:hypothetical protein QVD17_17344 [Tagetes erecta]
MNRDFFLDTETQFQPSPDVTGDGIFRRNWDKLDQFSQFESDLSSIVSSPVSGSTVSNEIAALRQLIGKLGAGFSPAAITPLTNPNLPFFPADPGFAERAAKFSHFGNRSFNDRINQLGLNSIKSENGIGISVSPVTCTGKFPLPAVGLKQNQNNSDEGESSVSEQIPSGEIEIKNRKYANSRKRKGGSNTKKEEDETEELKRLKKTEHENGGKIEEKTKAIEPQKDYIHVRARRGQATDSHSLAERVRREKISERMKLLQNLVPNCNKVTGKAVMLDEIINYVQSLQRQVEFLSMKLATVNPSVDFDTNDLISQYVNQSNENLSPQTSTFYQQNPQVVFNGSTSMTHPVQEYTEPFSQIQGFDQDDLQSIVRMGFGENLDLDTSFFQTGLDQPSNMKIEL